LHELTERYRAIGHSPLLEITEAQARGIEERTGITTYVGYKHVDPFIPDAVALMAKDGVDEAVGLVLAPHYSKMSVGDYQRRAEVAARELGWSGSLRVVKSWHLHEGFIELLAQRVAEAQRKLSKATPDEATVVFSAHSLPEKILAGGDPYPDQLRETAAAVADKLGLAKWRIGWQSAGRTADPWIGPDILDIVRELAADGTQGVIICPAGFVADHLEILFDVDIEAKNLADDLGIELVRTRSPNDDPAFLDILADVVKTELAQNA
ncbi:MAG: protoporphyrin/coproporphyrin ferrochelatase, partial [Actinomycetota bacterium]|nr:protoporphyrin/coproporphyrin ferrochelatase [Actinomycetota bacterium]